MKKVFYLIITMLLILPLSAKAFDGKINITCAKDELKIGETTLCKINVVTDTAVSGLQAKPSFGEHLSLDGKITSSIWQGEYDPTQNDQQLVLYNNESKTGTFEVASFTIKAGTVTSEVNEEITFTDVAFSDENDAYQTGSSLGVTIKIVPEQTEKENPDTGATIAGCAILVLGAASLGLYTKKKMILK